MFRPQRLLVLFFVCVAAPLACADGKKDDKKDEFKLTEDEQAVIDLTNAERKKAEKDGKPLDKDDSAFLRTNAPQVVDWVTTDEGRKVIAGTNFNLEEGNLEALRKRFVAEDYTGR